MGHAKYNHRQILRKNLNKQNDNFLKIEAGDRNGKYSYGRWNEWVIDLKYSDIR